MSTDQHQQGEAGAIKRVEEYKLAPPIRGYPMLQWAGKRPFTSTQYYPAQHKETYGPEVDGWRNKIYWGDNLQVMSHLLKEYRGKVKLVYIDPPFDSKADYQRTIRVRGKEATNDQSVFEEKQYADIWANDEYLQFMYERLILIKELLSEDGSLYLHCDWHKSHYLRLILDEIFGSDNFLNEIIWRRRTNTVKAISKKFSTNSETIFLYTKIGKDYLFNIQYSDYPIEYLERFKYEDERGKFRWQVMATFSQERLESLKFENRVRFSSGAKYPEFKQYIWELKGRPVENIWDDINMINAMGDERLDYPTQKPEALLERIIKASSNEGDIVFDCFMGSGTTQAVAMKLGRRFLGVDINLGAVQITTKRLLNDAAELHKKPSTLFADKKEPSVFYLGFQVYNVNNYDIFRNPVQAKELLLQALEVNPLQSGSLFDGEKDGCMVKIMPINRIATRQDLNELITGFDYRAFEKRQAEHPNQAVEKVTPLCMGHEPDLAAHLQHQMSPFKLDIEVVDILRDKQDLQFKRDSEAKIVNRDGYLVIEQFYPMNLLAKLSLQQEHVENWRELVDSIMVDWNYDGAVLQPAVIDVPQGNEFVAGRYRVPDDAGTIRVKITDLLSESLEMELTYG